MGLIVLLTNACEKDDPKLETAKVTDIEGNTYKTVRIGEQWWMAENLKTTKYNDNTDIPDGSRNGTAWAELTTPSFCWYNHNLDNKDVYGALYNWSTVYTSKLCPTGWHVPNDAEWTILIDFIGGLEFGDKLKETGTRYWYDKNTGATNETGFTALPGGERRNWGGFSDIHVIGVWWSSTEDDTDKAMRWSLSYANSNVHHAGFYKQYGYSVRCIKD